MKGLQLNWRTILVSRDLLLFLKTFFFVTAPKDCREGWSSQRLLSMEAPWWRRQQQRRLSPNLLSPKEISSSLFTHKLPSSWQLHFIYFFPSLCCRCQRRRRLFPASIWLIEELIASIRSETDRDRTPTAIEVLVLFDLESALPPTKMVCSNRTSLIPALRSRDPQFNIRQLGLMATCSKPKKSLHGLHVRAPSNFPTRHVS